MQHRTHPYLFYWLAAGFGLLVFLYLIKAILLPFVVGILAAYFLDPAADWLEEKKFSRSMATLTITVGFFLVTVAGLLLVAPVLYQQLSSLIGELPDYAARIQEYYAPQVEQLLERLGQDGSTDPQEALGSLSANAAGWVGDLLAGLLKSGVAMLNLLSLLLITPVVAFYLLRDWDVLVARVNTWLPQSQAHTVTELAGQIDQTLAGFIRGQLSACLLLSALYATALSIAGLKFGIIIGLVAGLLIIIPYVGTIVSGALAVGMAYVQFDALENVLIIAAIFIIGQVIEGYVITPKLVGRRVGLHPVWLIFGMLAGGALFGFVGILLAVPVTAVIGVLVRFVLTRYLDSGMYLEQKGSSLEKQS